MSLPADALAPEPEPDPELYKSAQTKPESNGFNQPLYQENNSFTQCDVQDKTAWKDASLREVWQGVMGFGHTGKPHREVAVLMISWAEELDDLKTKSEVQQLEGVFRDLFHYQVVRREIESGKSPGLQLTLHLAEFVGKFDSAKTLLIVYYAGHGFSKIAGELYLAGNRQTDEKSDKKNSAAWHNLEYIITDAESDALLIFDCCHAGSLIFRDGRSFNSSRSFEFIGACGHKATTGFPGKHSFTTALIWALTALVEERKDFSTQELQSKIMKAPDFPENQLVSAGECNEPCDQRLILSPMSTSSQPASPAPTISTEAKELPQNFVDLRLWYFDHPSKDEIENLAKRLHKCLLHKIINAQRIDWRGLKNVDQVQSEKVRYAADKFMSLLKSGRKSISQALYTNRDSLNTGGPSNSSAFENHANRSSTLDTRSDYPNIEASNTTNNMDKDVALLNLFEESEHNLEHILPSIIDIARGGTRNRLRHEDSTMGEGIELVGTGTRLMISNALQNLRPIFEIVAVLLLSVCLWYAFPLGGLFTFSTGYGGPNIG